MNNKKLNNLVGLFENYKKESTMDIKELNEGFKDAFKRGFEKVVPKVGSTGYNPAGEGNFGIGAFVSNAPKEDLEKLHFIGYVKFLQDEMNKGHSPIGRAGRVTDDDLKRYDDYKAWYDEYMADLEADDEMEDDLEYHMNDYDESYEDISKINEAFNNLFETSMNEISDKLADDVADKREKNRADAFAKSVVKSTPKNNKAAEKAEKKHLKNRELNSKRDARHGVVNTNNGRIPGDRYFSKDNDKSKFDGTNIGRYSKHLGNAFAKYDKKED